ncbi:hypothetical protein SAMN05421874_108145 [Nonomuraea maritima]|uniref:Uncharacterized protein n=1 Tax=Nonomuraea maritima TaxID=683260 RepID=A0A1G9CL94_9ACTN|nr:hypothetical protein [Nonomuraea maritima]SDK52359.1 hypothetical protein SAMN05421874_108145 [Nonomuraea maritima]
MGSRTAISAGVLAVALAAVPMGAPAASAQDCTRDGGLLSGVTNTLCDVVGVVTGTVDTLTGGTTEKLTEGVDKTTDEVLGRVGEVVPTTRPSTSRSADPADRGARDEPSEVATSERARPTTSLLPDDLAGICLPVISCVEDELETTPRPEATPPAERTQRPERRDESERERERDEAAVVPSVTSRPENRPQTVDTPRPVTKKRADPEEPRVELLWPNPFAHELAVPMEDRRVVRPTPPATDVLGTVLTIALLGSAVLAARIVQQRRARTEPSESIPFEPARAGGGRHRLA